MTTNAMQNYDPTLLLEKQMWDITPSMQYDGGDVRSWQKKLKSKLNELLGLNRKQVERCELNARSLWKRDNQYGTIEKIVFASEPGHDIPAYVCLPKNVTGPMPFFICLQGHSTGMHNSIAVAIDDETKTIEVKGDRDFGIGCIKRGIPAICIEQRAFGECKDTREEGCHPSSVMAIMMGRTLLGDRIFDVDRTIDYLESRGDVDMSRVGVMGNSGGGTVSMFAGGLLDRITHVMPSSSFSSFKASIMSIHHCTCNYIPNLLLYAESSDVVGLSAPKPMVIVNGVEDGIFPIKESKEEFEKLKRIYAAMGAAKHCHHVVCDGGHRFYADDAWDIMKREM